jgi:hypothetical protein
MNIITKESGLNYNVKKVKQCMDKHIDEKYEDKITVREDATVYFAGVLEKLFNYICGQTKEISTKLTFNVLKQAIDSDIDLKSTFAKAMYLHDPEESYECIAFDSDSVSELMGDDFTIKVSGRDLFAYLFDYLFEEVIDLSVIMKEYAGNQFITLKHVKSSVEYQFFDNLCEILNKAGEKAVKKFTICKNEKKESPKKATKKTKKAGSDDDDDTPVKKKTGKKVIPEDSDEEIEVTKKSAKKTTKKTNKKDDSDDEDEKPTKKANKKVIDDDSDDEDEKPTKKANKKVIKDDSDDEEEGVVTKSKKKPITLDNSSDDDLELTTSK